MRTQPVLTWRRLGHGLIFGGLLTSVACGGSNGGDGGGGGTTPPTTVLNGVSVAAVAGASTITVGGTAQFAATANFSDNTTQNVSNAATWASSNTAVASVSNTGLATGLAAGSANIAATHQGRTGSATLQVNAPAVVLPVAQFTVSGPGGNNVCRIIEDSNGDLDCTFNGSASTGGTGGAVTQWTWRFDVGTNSSDPINRTSPTHTPRDQCGFFKDTPDPTGTGFVQMIVKLVVQNAAGTTSQEVRNSNVRLFPQGQCGF